MLELLFYNFSPLLQDGRCTLGTKNLLVTVQVRYDSLVGKGRIALDREHLWCLRSWRSVSPNICQFRRPHPHHRQSWKWFKESEIILYLLKEEILKKTWAEIKNWYYSVKIIHLNRTKIKIKILFYAMYCKWVLVDKHKFK